MYSATIEPKVARIFKELKEKVLTIVEEAPGSAEAVDRVTRLAGSELATRSQSLLSDMLFALTDELMETEFFAEPSRQNRFFEIDLRREILGKYRFRLAPGAAVNGRDAYGFWDAAGVGGATLLIGGAAELGCVGLTRLPLLSKTPLPRLSLSDLVPGPLIVLLIVSAVAGMVDYFWREKKRNKRALIQALDAYFAKAEQQFLDWFDEVERYFDRRVDEIKRTM